MSYIGAAAIIFATYMMWREYSAFLLRGVDACRSYLAAMRDYRERVRCYMQAPGSWATEYSDDNLSDCGFLPHLSESGDFRRAYELSADKGYLTDEADGILKDCFERLGEGYLDTELGTLDLAIDKLSREEERLSESFVKRRRAAGAVLGAIASGTVILIM